MLGEPFSKHQPWLGVKMLLQELRPSFLPLQFPLDDPPTQLSFSQPAADEYQVTLPGSGAQYRFAAINFTQNGEAHHNFWILGGVASCQGQAESARRTRHAAQEIIEPCPGTGVRKAKCQEEVPCAGAHGGDVTG